MINQKKRILLTGGGTGGSVSPLLAIVDKLREQQAFEFSWIGTKDGPERLMVEKENIYFLSIASGKLRRYFSWKNFIDPVYIIIGFFQALVILLRWRPGLVMSVGGFVSVPVAWAAFLLRIPVWIHQQDVRPGLANKLMAPFAQVITVTFEKSLDDYGRKASWVGNPVRKYISGNRKYKNIKDGLPILLVTGGGTGSLMINRLVGESLEELTEVCQVIHIRGKNREMTAQKKVKHYHPFEFLAPLEMADALRQADVVVSRCGLATLSELSYLGKPAILIPMPDTHQEENAKIFKEHAAAIVLNEKEITKERFIKEVKEILTNEKLKNKLSKNIGKVIKKEADSLMADMVRKILNI